MGWRMMAQHYAYYGTMKIDGAHGYFKDKRPKLIGREERQLTAKLDGKIVSKRKEVGVLLSGKGQEGAVET